MLLSLRRTPRYRCPGAGGGSRAPSVLCDAAGLWEFSVSTSHQSEWGSDLTEAACLVRLGFILWRLFAWRWVGVGLRKMLFSLGVTWRWLPHVLPYLRVGIFYLSWPKKKKRKIIERYLKGSQAVKIIALFPLPVKVSESNFILLDSWLFFSFLFFFPLFKWSSPPPLSHGAAVLVRVCLLTCVSRLTCQRSKMLTCIKVVYRRNAW